MPVHSFHIFDRKGKTLFTKKYMKDDEEEDPTRQSEQRKLVFGMIFSLAQITNNLSPGSRLHSIQTGASILHTYESNSGMRLALYTTPNEKVADNSIQACLEYIFNELWINCVIRSPLYDPVQQKVADTNFEEKLDEYLGLQSWF